MGSPAYGGKGFQKIKEIRFEDHPRLCGEKILCQIYCVLHSGSPRLCGEKICGKQYQIERSGITPPMREKGIAFPAAMRCRGSPPAYAGKRRNQPECDLPLQDHPRLCGEKVLHVVQNFFIPGSPRLCGEKRTECYTKSAAWGSPRLCGEKLR